MKKIIPLFLSAMIIFTACNEIKQPNEPETERVTEFPTAPPSSAVNTPSSSVTTPNETTTAPDVTVLSNPPAPELIPITLEDAQAIIDYYNTYNGDFRYIREDVIENVQGEIKNPSVGLDSRVIEPAPYTEVYLFETDGNDSEHQYVYYAVTKMGGVLYVIESYTNIYGRDDVWVSLTNGFVPLDESTELPELVIYNVSATRLSYTLKNAMSRQWMYGCDFQLLIRNGTEWEPVTAIINDGMLVFTSEGYTVMPQSYALEMNVGFEQMFGVLPQGEYKFVKPIMDFRSTGDFTNYSLEQTFVIGADGNEVR